MVNLALQNHPNVIVAVPNIVANIYTNAITVNEIINSLSENPVQGLSSDLSGLVVGWEKVGSIYCFDNQWHSWPEFSRQYPLESLL